MSISINTKSFLLTYLAAVIGYVVATVLAVVLLLGRLVTTFDGLLSDGQDRLLTVSFLGIAAVVLGIFWVIVVLISAPLFCVLFLKNYPARYATAIILFIATALTPVVFYFFNIANQEVPLTLSWLLIYPGLARILALQLERLKSK